MMKIKGHEIKGAIFDVDGTLLDTMPMWSTVGVGYLAERGIEAEPNLPEILFATTTEMASEYMKERYGLTETVEEIRDGMNAIAERAYANTAQFKAGAAEFLDLLKDEGIPMAIATSTDHHCIKAAMDRLGYSDYFVTMLSAADVGAPKSEPKIFREAIEALGSEPSETWVFEDGYYAMQTVKPLGMKILGIYDAQSHGDQEDIKDISDVYIKEFTELL